MPETSLSDEITSAVDKAEAAQASSAEHTDATDPSSAPTREASVTAAPEVTRIPLADHERILDGYHKRLDSLSWANGLSRDEVEDALALRRTLNTREKATDEPKPDVLDEHQQPYYSPQQAAKWAAWQAQKIVETRMAEIEQRIGPIESTFTTQRLMGQIEEAKTWEGFTDNVDAITASLKDARAAGRPISLYEAYARVVHPQLVSTSTEREAELKKKWLAELNKTSDVVKDDLSPGKRPAATRKDASKMTIHEATAAAFNGSLTTR